MLHRYHPKHHKRSHLLRDLVIVIVSMVVIFTIIGAYDNGQWPFYHTNIIRHLSRKPKIKKETRVKTRVKIKKVPRRTKSSTHYKNNKHKRSNKELLSLDQAQMNVDHFWHNLNNVMTVHNVDENDKEMTKEFVDGTHNLSYRHLNKWITKVEDMQMVYDGQTKSINPSNFSASKNGDTAMVTYHVKYQFDWDIGNENGHNAYHLQKAQGDYVTTVNLKNGKIIKIKRE